ncbi:MAG: tRNA(Ile)-lysidine synthase [Actinomycetota bacterium]|jgi:tRNA(Ile)-lysidine synthase
MTKLHPESLQARNEVGKFLKEHASPGQRLLLAVSGGFDSLALAHMVMHFQEEVGYLVSALTVDHALQEQSAQWTKATVERLNNLGIDATSVMVKVDLQSAEGLEAAARAARYEALEKHAAFIGAEAILLAHTLDDQAETVLLRLAQGGSTNSIAGMRAVSQNLWRPLLGVRRNVLREYLTQHHIDAIDDPQNYDRRFTRVRVRQELLPQLIDVLGKDVVGTLATTAKLAGLDSDALEVLTDTRFAEVITENAVDCEKLRQELPAFQYRIVYRWLKSIGSMRQSFEHVELTVRLANQNQMKGPIRVPGLEIHKESGTLRAVRRPHG